MTPIPVGLVGAGKHGARYLRHLAGDVPELRVALVSRRDAALGRAGASAAGARFVSDFRDLVVSPEIAAVVAVVPPVLQLEIARLAAGAGKALLLEKPLAAGVVEAREIVAAVGRAGVPAMIAHTLRFNQVVRAIARELPAIGRIHQIALSQRFEPSRLDWLDDPARAGGGVILHTGVHSFDLVRFFSGRDPSSVVAFADRMVTERTEDAFAATFRFDGAPLLASVTGSRATASRIGAIELVGENGQLAGDHHHGGAWLLAGGERRALDTGEAVPTVRETLRAFARLLGAGEPPTIPLRDGLWSVACADACYRSIASGRSEAITA